MLQVYPSRFTLPISMLADTDIDPVKKTYFFCGVGGSGMSALAYLLLCEGHVVYGTDRSYDRGQSLEKFNRLEKAGIRLCPQDGSAVSAAIDILVVSAAVEDSIPDIKAAHSLNIPIVTRAKILSELFNTQKGIAVGGTSGKATVTGMIGFLLKEYGLDPTVVNGGVPVNRLDAKEEGLGNAIVGETGLFVAETDESDGSIDLFVPSIAVLNNIAPDHKPMEELRTLFSAFLSRATQGAVINLDNEEVALLKDVSANVLTYGIENEEADLQASKLSYDPSGVSFLVTNHRDNSQAQTRLQVPGNHNVSNALAAIATGLMLGIPLEDSVKILSNFKGMKRRMEVIGKEKDITVIDDFAHNPDKIAATLTSLKEFNGRLWVIFQPHGFGPMKMMRNDLVQVFVRYLSDEDILLMPEIYYAGGSTVKDISSRDILRDIEAQGKQTHFFDKREDMIPYLRDHVREGDRIIVMGARDDTLTDFAKEILAAIS